MSLTLLAGLGEVVSQSARIPFGNILYFGLLSAAAVLRLVFGRETRRSPLRTGEDCDRRLSVTAARRAPRRTGPVHRS